MGKGEISSPIFYIIFIMMNPENEKENPSITREVTISETMHRTVPLTTTNYIHNGIIKGEDWTEYEEDIDFSNTNWLEEYSDNHLTLEELLKEIPKFLIKIKPFFLYGDRMKAQYLISECMGWGQDEVEAVL